MKTAWQASSFQPVGAANSTYRYPGQHFIVDAHAALVRAEQTREGACGRGQGGERLEGRKREANSTSAMVPAADTLLEKPGLQWLLSMARPANEGSR